MRCWLSILALRVAAKFIIYLSCFFVWLVFARRGSLIIINVDFALAATLLSLG